MSRVPPENHPLPIPELSIADVATVLEKQAALEAAFLRRFAEEPMPGEMDRLRPAQIDQSLQLISALKIAAEAYRGFMNLSAPMQLSLGLLGPVGAKNDGKGPA